MEAMRVEDGAGEWWGWDEQRALTQWGGAELAARGSVWRGPSARSVECTVQQLAESRSRITLEHEVRKSI